MVLFMVVIQVVGLVTASMDVETRTTECVGGQMELPPT